MANPAPGYQKNPDHPIRLESSPRRVRVKFGDTWIADSTDMALMFEHGHLPVYYFPKTDVRMEFLHATEHSTHCPYKGHARYWSIDTGSARVENAVWGYPAPYDEMVELGLEDYLAFYWNRVDHWYEEDEEIFVHPRDPYKRVDAIPSSRAVKVILGGETVADTTRAHFLFETGLPTRYYIPRDDVRMDLLTPTATQSRCPYKGIASYWSARTGDEVHEDIVWSYESPISECGRIEKLVCFYNENVDAILVDGCEQEKPQTKWSR